MRRAGGTWPRPTELACARGRHDHRDGLDQFLRENGDPALNSWADVDGDTVFPADDAPVAVWITRARGGFDWQRLAELVKQGLPESYDDVPDIDHLLRGLEQARTADFEDWLTENGLDAVVFPAAGGVGRADLFSRTESREEAMRNGVVYSNGNRVLRHLGIPSVTVPMGVMGDIQMPVGLTFAGAAYSDDRLLDLAGATRPRRRAVNPRSSRRRCPPTRSSRLVTLVTAVRRLRRTRSTSGIPTARGT